MSSSTIGPMGRWEPNARERLQRAALDLFVEVGFTEATVPQITSRAGLTTRTFFRHFADKREVLFAAEQELPALVARLMSEAPESLTPMMLVEHGLRIVATSRFEGNLDHLRTRRTVVRSDEGLRERELRKYSVLSDAIRREFAHRGVDELTATVIAQIAVTVLGVSVDRWLDQDGERPLTELIDDTLGALRSVIRDQDGPTPPLVGDGGG